MSRMPPPPGGRIENSLTSLTSRLFPSEGRDDLCGTDRSAEWRWWSPRGYRVHGFRPSPRVPAPIAALTSGDPTGLLAGQVVDAVTDGRSLVRALVWRRPGRDILVASALLGSRSSVDPVGCNRRPAPRVRFLTDGNGPLRVSRSGEKGTTSCACPRPLGYLVGGYGQNRRSGRCSRSRWRPMTRRFGI